ncbi:MAG: ATP-binding protein [Candidatus Latescibacteria bacterium]|nr:ATP-binding protein [Candidatus Latescibacterota bacterium]
MSARQSFRIEADLDELRRVAAAAEELGLQEDWSPALVHQVDLAIEEIGNNIVRHGFGGGPGEIEITLTSESDAITIEISDDGRAFNPLEDAPIPDVEAALEDRPIGGLGVHLVLTMIDEMHYRRENERNHLTLVKRRT